MKLVTILEALHDFIGVRTSHTDLLQHVLKFVRKDVLFRLVCPLVPTLIFNMAAGGHFEFQVLQHFTQIIQTSMVGYFATNTLKYLDQPSKFISQRLVTEPKILTLLCLAL